MSCNPLQGLDAWTKHLPTDGNPWESGLKLIYIVDIVIPIDMGAILPVEGESRSQGAHQGKEAFFQMASTFLLKMPEQCSHEHYL